MESAQHHQQVSVSPTFNAEAYIDELLGFIRLYAGMAQDCLDANDPACFNYAIASMTARVRQLVMLMNPAQEDAEQESGH